MIKPVFLSLIVLLLVSCRDEDRFTVVNKSGKPVKDLSIGVFPNKGSKVIQLQPNETADLSIDSMGGSDGSYLVTYTIDQEQFSIHCGYFTNGLQLEDSLTILADTIKLH